MTPRAWCWYLSLVDESLRIVGASIPASRPHVRKARLKLADCWIEVLRQRREEDRRCAN